MVAFGPIEDGTGSWGLGVVEAEDEEEIRAHAADDPAVHQAADDRALLEATNAGRHGLAAYVYSEDLERAWAFAERVEAGAVGINVNDTTDLQAPFGGWKLSGLGRELGPEGLRTYLEPRHLRMRVRPLT